MALEVAVGPRGPGRWGYGPFSVPSLVLESLAGGLLWHPDGFSIIPRRASGGFECLETGLALPFVTGPGEGMQRGWISSSPLTLVA